MSDEFNKAPASTAIDVCEHLVRSLVDDPDAVEIDPEERRRGGYTLRVHVAQDDMAQTVNFGTADTAEAMMAFAEKRDPKFQGK